MDEADGLTNADRRIANLIPPGKLQPGVYRLVFETGDYFITVGQAEFFYPTVVIVFW